VRQIFPPQPPISVIITSCRNYRQQRRWLRPCHLYRATKRIYKCEGERDHQHWISFILPSVFYFWRTREKNRCSMSRHALAIVTGRLSSSLHLVVVNLYELTVSIFRVNFYRSVLSCRSCIGPSRVPRSLCYLCSIGEILSRSVYCACDILLLCLPIST
jgi:hypothetical protein